MPKYLFQASYAPEGIRGLLKEGATTRRNVAEALVKSLGGKLECFYYCLGSDDVVAIADLPDNATAAALSVTVNATGLVRGRMTPLLNEGEAQKALGREAIYHGPGTIE
jgi:uncharacterized protein with GYD domain